MADDQCIREAFYAKVDRSGDCWIWLGPKDWDGYGFFWFGRKQHRTHRLALTLEGVEIPRGMFVCHHCDNPSCVRPSHLFVGSHADNMRDCAKKGRTSRGRTHRTHLYPEKVLRGERIHFAKLTADSVRRMRAEWATGVTATELARRYGVSRATASRACAGITWAHV